MDTITYDKYKKLPIEERSQAFVNRLENFETKAEKEYAMVGYITGATEQRKIDIDKACEWIMATPMYAKQPATLVDEFKKFMEE